MTAECPTWQFVVWVACVVAVPILCVFVTALLNRLK